MSLADLQKALAKKFDPEQMPTYKSFVEDQPAYETTTTGSLAIDVALGTGGWVKGRLHEISGIPGVGKTSLMLTSMAAQQEAYPDQGVVYIDMERTFDPSWAMKMGVDLDPSRFIHLKPQHAEDVSDMLRLACASGDASCVVIDSIGAMESQKALEKDAIEVTMGKNAQVITRMVKQAATAADDHGVTVLMVNQLRANLANPMAGEMSAGPKALAYALSIVVRLTKGANAPKKMKIAGNEEIVSKEIRARIIKNKVGGGEGRTATFVFNTAETLEFGAVGIDRMDEVMRVGIDTGAIIQRGAMYTLPDESKVKGREAVAAALREDPNLAKQIRAKAIEIIQGKTMDAENVQFTPGDAESEE